MWGSTGRREGTYDLVNVGRDGASDQILGGEAKKVEKVIGLAGREKLIFSVPLRNSLVHPALFRMTFEFEPQKQERKGEPSFTSNTQLNFRALIRPY